LDDKVQDPDLWNDPENAQKLLQSKSLIENNLKLIDGFDSEYQYLRDLIEISESEKDDESFNDAVKSLNVLFKSIEKAKFATLFNKPEDKLNCFLEIHPGAGGTESHDWAEILSRMYIRFAEREGFNLEVLDEQKGDEAGLKTFTVKISGLNSYGWLKTESGVHRLVRISPFNSAGKRMTSFASVWVYPEVDDSIEINIEAKDLRVDTYRASGAGGQHINKTDSAIRITHLPTNIVVQCQNSRSQHRNREEAMKMLKSRLYESELQKQQDKIDQQNAEKTDNSWGNQIRSYVLQPYQQVKDLRSNYATSNVQAVLDGDLEEIVKSVLSGVS
jgi:peptide chain release factor 2